MVVTKGLQHQGRCRATEAPGTVSLEGLRTKQYRSVATVCAGSSWFGEAQERGQALGPVKLGGLQQCLSGDPHSV